MSKADNLKIKLFQDGAELSAIQDTVKTNPLIKGFTTNPSLMRKAGISDYAAFAKQVIEVVGDLPISFEVFSDEFEEMEREARVIRSWGGNTYVKIPVTNTRGDSAAPLIRKLSNEGIALNVTALLTLDQVKTVADALAPSTPSIVSVFAGRIADTGIDPMPLMREAVDILADNPNAELLWASPRELLNVFQADEVGCHIITATKDVLAKLSLVGKDLTGYSLETVKMFFDDAKAAGYKLH
ncbi:MAG TPA: transaldolase [Stellaceae bacterium]|nr:transaldolase [Stellaceae bacterium]